MFGDFPASALAVALVVGVTLLALALVLTIAAATCTLDIKIVPVYNTKLPVGSKTAIMRRRYSSNTHKLMQFKYNFTILSSTSNDTASLAGMVKQLLDIFSSFVP